MIEAETGNRIKLPLPAKRSILLFTKLALCSRAPVFQMKCFRRILNIRRQQKIRNEEVLTRTSVTWDIHVVQTITEKKLNLFRHTCRMPNDRLLKQVVFIMMDGSNGRGGSRRRWTDDVEEWCNNDLHTLSMIEVADRTECRQIVKRALDNNGH